MTVKVLTGSKRGLVKNTFKIIAVILIARLFILIFSNLGIIGVALFGFWILFVRVIAVTFEATAKISIVSTDSFRDAVDNATSVTKGLYIKVAIISLIFAILQFAFVPDDNDVYIPQVYNPTEQSEETTEDSVESTIERYYNSDGYRSSVIAPDIINGIIETLSSAFILIYCAHHFVEDKQITDSAMDRLNGKF